MKKKQRKFLFKNGKHIINQNIYYYKDGELHREDGPAVEYTDGEKHWYKNGRYHREDGPAIEYPNGTKCWYRNDLRHREDGPAIEWDNGYKEWYLNGNKHTEEEFFKLTKSKNGLKNNLEKILLEIVDKYGYKLVKK